MRWCSCGLGILPVLLAVTRAVCAFAFIAKEGIDLSPSGVPLWSKLERSNSWIRRQCSTRPLSLPRHNRHDKRHSYTGRSLESWSSGRQLSLSGSKIHASLRAEKDAQAPYPHHPFSLSFQLATVAKTFMLFTLQCFTLLAFYLFHMTVLTQHMAILFGCLAVGYDTLVGAAVALWYVLWYRLQRRRLPSRNDTTVPIENSSSSFPWNLPTAPPLQLGLALDTTDDASVSIKKPSTAIPTKVTSTSESSISWRTRLVQWSRRQSTATYPATTSQYQWIRFRLSFLVTVAALIKAYFSTGNFSLFWEDLLFTMSAAGWPLTIPLSRSLQVLMGHLTWVTVGSLLLWAGPRPPPFFASLMTDNRDNQRSQRNDATKSLNQYHWFRISSRNWLWWSIGGYYVSSFLFNMADGVNRLVLPVQVLQEAAESVVAQLVQPEHNDVWASVVGYLAPCVSAPIWEELLYRGFGLAGLTAATGSWHASCLWQALIFSAHHMSVTAALPLAVLGWTWAVLYTHSRNLTTVMVVHAMWNSRVFFGSWFGL